MWTVIHRRCEDKQVNELVFTLNGQMWTPHRFRQALEGFIENQHNAGTSV